MHDAPLVSIIMPTYNRGGYILETIQSIIDQTYKNWELIILDDGSEDNTHEIIANVTDSRIQYIKHEHTGITGILKNKGIELAKGALIALMDSDDLWMRDKLELQVDALLQNPKARFAITNGYNFYTDGTPNIFFYNKKKGIEYMNILNQHCKGEMGIRTPTLLFWKDCLKKTGNFGTKYRFTDFSFIGNLSYHFLAAVVYTPLLACRRHDDNSTYNLDEYFETIDDLKNKGMLSTAVAAEAKFIMYINCGNYRVNAGNKTEAMIFYLKGWSIKPFSIIPFKKIVKALFAK
jgi:glycosyltransferase involved in cell wall biosynthesis